MEGQKLLTVKDLKTYFYTSGGVSKAVDGVSFEVEKGEILVALTPGAGGFGDPKLREPERVLADVADGYVSLESARRDYGVVVLRDADGICALDAEATRALREESV